MAPLARSMTTESIKGAAGRKAAAALSTGRSLKRLASVSSLASASTRAPSCSRVESGDETETSVSEPPSKRACGPACSAEAVCQKPRRIGSRELCRVVHQFGLVGGEDYDSKETRLEQILARLPRGSAALIFAAPAAARAVGAVLAKQRQAQAWDYTVPRALATPVRSSSNRVLDSRGLLPTGVYVEVLYGSTPRLPDGLDKYSIIINYDIPSTGDEYARRAGVALEAVSNNPGAGPAVVYTMVQERQLRLRGCQETLQRLRSARRMAKTDASLGGGQKMAEIDSAILYLSGNLEEDEEEGDEEEGGDDDCTCSHCRTRSTGSISYHSAEPSVPLGAAAPRVEVVRVHLQALEDFGSVAPLIASRVPGHTCTLVCLHNMYCHTPWDGHEHLFGLPPGMGAIRVVMVLATDTTWHDYPDTGSFAGGVAWMDILDMDSMNKADQLLERLVDHEVSLLNGQGNRLVLMGASQGGGQSMLRFLKSKYELGGWIGAVCHAPIAPHAPRDRDPLLVPGRPVANLARPMRLLAGALDTTFPAPLVQRDAERLRKVGGFQDVAVTVVEGLNHEGFEDGRDGAPVELLFVREHLPSMVFPEAAGVGARAVGGAK